LKIFRTDGTLQEKAEGLIKLPEPSAIIKSILEFCYSGDYVDDGDDGPENKALQNAKLYLAADKYDIREMDEIIWPRVMEHIDDCEEFLKKHTTLIDSLGRPEDVEVALAKVQTVWDGLLLTVRFLLENCRENDSIRHPLTKIDWTSIAKNGFRADWLELVAAQPGYAVDVLAIQNSERWQLEMIKSRAEAEIAATRPPDGWPTTWDDDWSVGSLRAEWARAETWFDARLSRLSSEMQW